MFAFTIDDAGTATLRIFNVGSSTPIWSKTDISGQNYVSASPFAAIDIGGGTTNTTIAGMDDQVNTGTGSEIPDYVPTTPLATPTVSAPSSNWVDPTVIGGSNGSAIASWPAVPNATSYEAWKANTATPAAGDWTLVASGVTSPYKFTGLTGSVWALGIKAKA